MILIACALLLAIIIFVFCVSKDKMLHLSTEISTIEEKINSTLLRRKELLKDSEALIKDLINTKKIIYDGFDVIDNSNMIEFDRSLLVYVKEFYLIKDKYNTLQDNEDFQKLAFAMNETEDLLTAYKAFYNNTAEKYNKLIKSFPFGICSAIKKRKNKEFFD